MSLARRSPTDAAASGESTEGLTHEEAFETLSNERRRHVVRWLLEHGTEVDLRELSRAVAARENDKRAERVDRQERRRVYNALQQFHLPKLDDLGVVRYDAGRGTVESTEALSSLRAYLDVTDRRREWCPYALAAGGVAAGLAATGLAVGRPAVPLLAAAAVALVGAAVAVDRAGDSDRVPADD